MNRTMERFLFAGARGQAMDTVAAWPSVVLIGRALLALIFLGSGISKIMDWAGNLEYMRGQGIPFAPLLLALAVVVEIIGGLSVLTGTLARPGALLLFGYLAIVTVVMHDFWELSGPPRQVQMVNFLKNLSILGGLLLVAGMGPGGASVDRQIRDRRSH